MRLMANDTLGQRAPMSRKMRDGEVLAAHERPRLALYLDSVDDAGQHTFARISGDGAVEVWGAADSMLVDPSQFSL